VAVLRSRWPLELAASHGCASISHLRAAHLQRLHLIQSAAANFIGDETRMIDRMIAAPTQWPRVPRGPQAGTPPGDHLCGASDVRFAASGISDLIFCISRHRSRIAITRSAMPE
jgi:hypothetical protein